MEHPLVVDPTEAPELQRGHGLEGCRRSEHPVGVVGAAWCLVAYICEGGLLSRALVTGGTGFLGRHLVLALESQGTEVRLLRRDAALAAELEGVDIVYHLAWTTLPHSSDENPRHDLETNVGVGISLLDACVRAGVRMVVFPSSGGTVYGPTQREQIDELAPTHPICSHGVTKLTFEKYLSLYRRLRSLDYRVLRISNAYGEGQRSDRSQGLIGVALQRASDGRPMVVWGDGLAVRDYIHVSDVVAGCIAATRDLGPASPRTFNLSSGHGHSVRDVLTLVEGVTGRSLRVAYDAPRTCDLDRAVLANALAREHLGFEPRVALEDGLRATWAALVARQSQTP